MSKKIEYTGGERADGKIVAVGPDFDHGKHLIPKKKLFRDHHMYYSLKAKVLRASIAENTKLAEKYEIAARKLKETPPEAAKLKARIDRMSSTAELLKKKLAEMGVRS